MWPAWWCGGCRPSPVNPIAVLGGLATEAGTYLDAVNELGLLDDAESIGNVRNGLEGPEAAGQL